MPSPPLSPSFLGIMGVVPAWWEEDVPQGHAGAGGFGCTASAGAAGWVPEQLSTRQEMFSSLELMGSNH